LYRNDDLVIDYKVIYIYNLKVKVLL